MTTTESTCDEVKPQEQNQGSDVIPETSTTEEKGEDPKIAAAVASGPNTKIYTKEEIEKIWIKEYSFGPDDTNKPEDELNAMIKRCYAVKTWIS